MDYEKDHGQEQLAEARQKMEQAKAEAQVSFECAMSIVAPHLSLTAPQPLLGHALKAFKLFLPWRIVN